MIYTCKPERISLYINTDRKTIAQIKAETGCTALINGGLFDMGSYKPVCHLKADGLVLSRDQYKYWGFAWDTNELVLTQAYSKYKNYICCVCLVKDGQAAELIYNDDLGGYRPRTAIGVFDDGRVWLYADATNKWTPKQLQQFALKQGVKHAIMLDGGGSTQGACPNDTLAAPRIVHNYICVWEALKSPEKPQETEVVKMFRLALGAGHGLNTAGKRCLKSLDKNETREWWLNDRICDYVEAYLKDYEGYELLRLDDSDDGKDDVALAARVNEANKWGADFYLSVHHNAGINGGKGGGIVAYSYPNSAKGAEWRDALYDRLIAKTGLKGNRATPKATANYYVLKYTKMCSALLELGYMDSATDVPIILTDDYAQKCARAIVEVIAERGKLTKKKITEESKVIYKVQVGAFSKKANAEALVAELKAKGYSAYITKV